MTLTYPQVLHTSGISGLVGFRNNKQELQDHMYLGKQVFVAVNANVVGTVRTNTREKTTYNHMGVCLHC
jgi:hypothetical protein